MKRLLSTVILGLAFAVLLIGLGRLVVWLLPAATAPGPLPESGPDHPLIIVGESWEPFEYQEGGQPQGINAEVLARIFGKLGVRYELRFYPWSRAWYMAQSGEADAVISISYKQNREDHLLFTESQRRFAGTGEWPAEYLWEAEYVFFCRRLHKDSFHFESYEQIRNDGYRLATIQDYSYDPAFLAADFRTRKVPDQETAFRLLVEGEIDLFPHERTVGQAALQRLGIADQVTFIKTPLFRKPYLMPFCRQSSFPEKEQLMQRFYEELDELRRSGEYEQIYRRYIPAGPPP